MDQDEIEIRLEKLTNIISDFEIYVEKEFPSFTELKRSKFSYIEESLARLSRNQRFNEFEIVSDSKDDVIVQIGSLKRDDDIEMITTVLSNCLNIVNFNSKLLRTNLNLVERSLSVYEDNIMDIQKLIAAKKNAEQVDKESDLRNAIIQFFSCAEQAEASIHKFLSIRFIFKSNVTFSLTQIDNIDLSLQSLRSVSKSHLMEMTKLEKKIRAELDSILYSKTANDNIAISRSLAKGYNLMNQFKSVALKNSFAIIEEDIYSIYASLAMKMISDFIKQIDIYEDLYKRSENSMSIRYLSNCVLPFHQKSVQGMQQRLEKNQFDTFLEYFNWLQELKKEINTEIVYIDQVVHLIRENSQSNSLSEKDDNLRSIGLDKSHMLITILYQLRNRAEVLFRFERIERERSSYIKELFKILQDNKGMLLDLNNQRKSEFYKQIFSKYSSTILRHSKVMKKAKLVLTSISRTDSLINIAGEYIDYIEYEHERLRIQQQELLLNISPEATEDFNNDLIKVKQKSNSKLSPRSPKNREPEDFNERFIDLVRKSELLHPVQEESMQMHSIRNTKLNTSSNIRETQVVKDTGFNFVYVPKFYDNSKEEIQQKLSLIESFHDRINSSSKKTSNVEEEKVRPRESSFGEPIQEINSPQSSIMFYNDKSPDHLGKPVIRLIPISKGTEQSVDDDLSLGYSGRKEKIQKDAPSPIKRSEKHKQDIEVLPKKELRESLIESAENKPGTSNLKIRSQFMHKGESLFYNQPLDDPRDKSNMIEVHPKKEIKDGYGYPKNSILNPQFLLDKGDDRNNNILFDKQRIEPDLAYDLDKSAALHRFLKSCVNDVIRKEERENFNCILIYTNNFATFGFKNFEDIRILYINCFENTTLRVPYQFNQFFVKVDLMKREIVKHIQIMKRNVDEYDYPMANNFYQARDDAERRFKYILDIMTSSLTTANQIESAKLRKLSLTDTEESKRISELLITTQRATDVILEASNDNESPGKALYNAHLTKLVKYIVECNVHFLGFDNKDQASSFYQKFERVGKILKRHQLIISKLSSLVNEDKLYYNEINESLKLYLVLAREEAPTAINRILSSTYPRRYSGLDSKGIESLSKEIETQATIFAGISDRLGRLANSHSSQSHNIVSEFKGFLDTAVEYSGEQIVKDFCRQLKIKLG